MQVLIELNLILILRLTPAGSGKELSCCSLLKGGVRGSLVATSAATRCQGPRFYPARAEIWIEFSAPCAPLFRLWNHNIGDQSQSQDWKLT